jgi:hypothetical protein
MAPTLFPGDFALTGQGRVFALHMLQARQVCEVGVTIHEGERTEPRDLKLPGLAPRSICDPVIYYNRVRNICRWNAASGQSRTVDFSMRVRRTTETDFRLVADTKDFCNTVHDYSLLSSNAWLH